MLDADRRELEYIAPTIRAAEEAAEATGIPLFPAQKTLSPSRLEEQSFVSQLQAGREVAKEGLDMQNEASNDAVASFIDYISPPEAMETGAIKVRTAAQKAVDKKIKIRKEKASPLFEAAFKEGAVVDLKPVNDLINDQLADMSHKGEIYKTLNKTKSLIKVKGKGKGKGLIKVKAPSLRFLHNSKIEIDRMLNKIGSDSLGNATKYELKGVQLALLKQMDDASPSYKIARGKFEAESPAVTEIQDSIIGKIAALDDTQLNQVTRKLFNLSETNPKVLLKAKKYIQDIDPEAWNEITRVEFERRLSTIKFDAEDMNAENVPGQLYRALFPNDGSTKLLMVALDAEGKKNLEFLRTALGRARLGRVVGSQTASRQEIIRELRGGIFSSIGESAYHERVKLLSKVLFDSTWKAEMKRTRTLDRNSPATAMTQLLNDVEQSEPKTDSQTGEQSP